MRKIILIAAILFAAITSHAQNVAVNNTGNMADASAMLDVSSHDKGVLVPRLRTIERTAIGNPAQGLLVYDIDTRTFWFYDITWKELLYSGAGVPLTGVASGDLYGNYPSPSVGKIQNLNVAFGVPFDKQILKWDALNNTWQGLNDSLFLPYNVTFGSATNLFGITNANITPGSTAIFGRSSISGSGITPANTTGVWGDNSSGSGVVGTSNTGLGVTGVSFNNNGVQGYSVLAGRAGVYGSHANDGGIGIMGEIQNNGFAIYGKTTGATGKAGLFESTSSTHTDTTIKIQTPGLGILSSFINTNTTTTKPVMDIIQEGNGNGIKLRLNKITGSANGIDILSKGTGAGIYSKSEAGMAGKFEIATTGNSSPALQVATNSLGTALSVNSTNLGTTGDVVDVSNQGNGLGLSVDKAGLNGYNVSFSSTNVNNTESNLVVEHEGKGRGIEVNLTNAANTSAGIYVNTVTPYGVNVTASGNGAVAISAFTGSTANNAIGVRGSTGSSVSGGIGVLGMAGTNDHTGIGVKGIAGGGIAGGIGVLGEGQSANPQAIGVKGTSYTHNEDVGAVTGINFVDGVGVYGESWGDDGIGVAGRVGTTGSKSVAAAFTNVNVNNDRAVVELISNGKGNAIYSENTNLSNPSPIIRIRNAGTGEFAKFENNLGVIVTTIAKSGDINTDGTLTVKGDKGIVRNSSSTQMRMETLTATVPAGSLPHYDQFNSEVSVTVTFATSFSSAPAVFIGNVTSGSIQGLTATVENVTANSCKLKIRNYNSNDFSFVATTYKLVAIGAE